MKRKSIGTNYSMCVQPTFIIGTYNEDDSPDFAPITWVSATCEGEDYLLVVSMFGTKKTKQNVIRTKSLSVNLASTDMLNLVDYFGNPQKSTGKPEYSYKKSEYVSAPVLDISRWVYECEVVTSVKTGVSDTFFCRIKNIQIDENVEIADTFDVDLTKFDPIIYSGQYHSIGKRLGKIGDFLENKTE
ncbi:MAG: flavin reductase family protein [Prevotella sp.]|nr:flavin reductase family protein [Prevotella sp.]